MKFSSLVCILALAHGSRGATLDWTANPEEKIEIKQCEDLTFAISGTHNIKNMNKKGRAKRCDFSQSTLMLDTTTNGQAVISGNNFLKRKKYFYGCDVNNHCKTINQKTMVEVIPDFTKTTGQACSTSGAKPIKTFPLSSIAQCESVCSQKDDCMAFSFDPDEAKPCHLYDVVRVPSGQAKTGAACYTGRTECPPISAPHCSVEAEVKCTLRDDPTKECKEYAASFPTEVPGGNLVGCQVYLKYDYLLTARTTEPSTWTWATRTRKGDEPEDFARARVYSWLDEGAIPSPDLGPGTASLPSSETVLVDFCKKGKYKTLAEAVIISDSNTICTDRNQYKLTVKGASTPAPPTPTPGSSVTPPAGGLPPCGFEAPKVGCVIAEGQTGPPKDWTGTTDCNSYVPATTADCSKNVRYTYYVYHGPDPAGSKMISALRYRKGSYWENNPKDNPHGNPRKYQTSRWGTEIASGGVNTFYEINQWEGEVVNFCQPREVETRFEFKTDGAGIYECDKAGEYTLITRDLAPPKPGGGLVEPSCNLEISLECKIDNTDINCNEYEPSSASECERTATYIHTMFNPAPLNSGQDILLTSITRNRPGDIPHGANFDFLDDQFNGEPYLLAAPPGGNNLVIRELPTINFCTDNRNYVTTFNTISTPDGGTTQCNNQVTYTLNLSS